MCPLFISIFPACASSARQWQVEASGGGDVEAAVAARMAVVEQEHEQQMREAVERAAVEAQVGRESDINLILIGRIIIDVT